MSDAAGAGAVNNEAGGTQQTTEGTQNPAGTGEQGKQNAAPAGNDTAAGAGDDKFKAGDKPAGDEVAFEFKPPEGVELDQASLDEFTKIVKDPKLTPSERAQALADLAVKREADRHEAYANTVKGWAEQVAADKELGVPENQAAVRKVIESFGTPELKDLLNSTGMGNHPELVRFALKVSKAVSEDAIHQRRGDAPAMVKDPAAILYDKTPAN